MTIQSRIFLGFMLNYDIKMHLNQNSKWKEDKLIGKISISETQWEGKEYIGHFTPPLISYFQLKEHEQELRAQMQIYCPKLNFDKYSVFVFSQIFLF